MILEELFLKCKVLNISLIDLKIYEKGYVVKYKNIVAPGVSTLEITKVFEFENHEELFELLKKERLL